MTIYSPGYNKMQNLFEQGIRQIRNKNNNFFENASGRNTIYDLKDIKSYFDVVVTMGKTVLKFRTNSGLPEAIRNDISKLFYSIWPEEVVAEKEAE